MSDKPDLQSSGLVVDGDSVRGVDTSTQPKGVLHSLVVIRVQSMSYNRCFQSVHGQYCQGFQTRVCYRR